MAQRLDPIQRHPGLILLARRAAEGALPQSLLLEGPEGSAKEAAALHLAAVLLAGDDAAARSKVLRLRHPDLHFVFPAESGLSAEAYREILDEKAAEPLARIRQPSSAVIAVGDSDKPHPCSVREVRRFVAAVPFEAPARVAILSDAHRMNRSAANALLKTLEEPPATAWLLLTTHQPHLLPATVRSRCAKVRVPGLGEAELAAHLEATADLEADEAARIAAVSGGDARRAFDLVDPEARLLAGWAQHLLPLLLRGEGAALLKGAERVAKGQDPAGGKGKRLSDAGLTASRDVAVRTLDFLAADLLALSRLGAGARLSEAHRRRLAPVAEAAAGRDTTAMARLLLAARDDLLRNVNVSLVLTHTLLEASGPATEARA